MSRPTLNELFEKSAPVICASCYLGGAKFERDSVCPNTAKAALQSAKNAFDKVVVGSPDDETVNLEVYGDTVDDRRHIETTLGKVREGFDSAIVTLGEKATKCAANVGRHVINGRSGLKPLETFTKVDISNLSQPK